MVPFAQSLTNKPMKGMLTGPVTILQWSFVRDDQPRAETCRQIALAMRDEVLDLESAGIASSKSTNLPCAKACRCDATEWPTYLDWAVECLPAGCLRRARRHADPHPHVLCGV